MLLKKLLEGINNTLSSKQVQDGMVSFGIKEYIQIPGLSFNRDLGILGFDVTATFARPGYRVERRKIKKGKVARRHKVNQQEVIEWLRREFGCKIE